MLVQLLCSGGNTVRSASRTFLRGSAYLVADRLNHRRHDNHKEQHLTNIHPLFLRRKSPHSDLSLEVHPCR